MKKETEREKERRERRERRRIVFAAEQIPFNQKI